jgi:hypothetical protein
MHFGTWITELLQHLGSCCLYMPINLYWEKLMSLGHNYTLSTGPKIWSVSFPKNGHFKVPKGLTRWQAFPSANASKLLVDTPIAGWFISWKIPPKKMDDLGASIGEWFMIIFWKNLPFWSALLFLLVETNFRSFYPFCSFSLLAWASPLSLLLNFSYLIPNISDSSLFVRFHVFLLPLRRFPSFCFPLVQLMYCLHDVLSKSNWFPSPCFQFNLCLPFC